MKILSIKGKNLASIEGEFNLDFTVKPLVNAGIFAITGITGAGKSTILDALCLALYARTPRQKSAKENNVRVKDGKDGFLGQGDPRLIMRKGCHEAMAAVSFIGIDSHPYAASWNVRRARNQAHGQMQDYSITLHNLSTGQPFLGKKNEVMKEIEKLVGMNFDQFTRSVLLAQGEFTAFLKADQNEKSELLEKLTGTDVYSRISSMVHIKTKEAEQNVKEVEIKLLDLEVLSDEEVTFYSLELDSLKKEIFSLKSQQQDLIRQKDWRITLDRLNHDLELAATILKESKEEKENSIPRQSFLSTVEGVQVSRSLVQQKRSSHVSLLNKQASIEATEKQLEALKESISLIRQDLSATEELYLSAKQKNVNAKKDLIRARELDTQIASCNKNQNTLTGELDLLKRKLEDNKKELYAKNSEHKLTSELVTQTIDWLSNNKSRKPIAEKFNIILLKLKEASTNLNRQASFQNKIDESNKIIQCNKEEISLLNHDLSNFQVEYEAILQSVNAYEETIANLNPTILELEKEACLASIKELDALLNNWDKQIQVKALIEDTEFKLKLTCDKIANAEINIGKASTELIAAEIKKRQTEKLLINAKLRSSESITELRDNLEPGEPCAVCGSKEHPYATQNEKLHLILDSIENEYRACEEEHKSLLTLHSSLSSQKKYLLEEKENLTNQLNSNKISLTGLTNDWNSLFGHERFESIAEKSKLDSLKQEYNLIESKLEEITNKILNTKELILELDKLKQKLNIQTESISLLKETLVKKNNLITLHDQQKNQAVEELTICNENINLIEKEIGAWFSKDGWSDAWKANPEKFINEITIFSESWKEKNLALTEKERLVQILSSQIKALEGHIIEREYDLAKKVAQLDEVKKEIEHLTFQRAVFFDGKSCDEAEMEYNENESNAKNALEQVKLAMEKLGSEIDTLKGTLLQLENDKIKYSTALNEAALMIDEWLNKYNENRQVCIDENTLDELLNINLEWINQERAELAILDDNILKAQATYDERETQVKKHESMCDSTFSLDELNETLEISKLRIEDLIKSETTLTVKLLQDEKNKRQSSLYLDEIKKRNAKLVQWKKLDEVIGSADGKKFRQIAQKYTLEILLGYANKHLKSLSPRYQLQCVPETLALQVVDHDMGDEVRSVHYLSGGESFLVSLALALGLASLSSNRMKVESLFIDEGFGSLDPETLRTAMDALERLHNDGRKVGVISHVQEMTERIPVQVQVIKLAGKSKVEIKG